jgi:hypothetical protein
MCVYEILPGLTYDCRANDRDVQGDEAGAVPKEEIQASDPDAQPETAWLRGASARSKAAWI